MAKAIKGRQLNRRTWIAGGLVMAMTPVLTACGGGDVLELEEGRETPTAAGDFQGNYNYGTSGSPRQVLDLYGEDPDTVSSPRPVYIWAHPNQSTYRTNIPSDDIRRQLRERGLQIISWESETSLTQDNEPTVTADAYLMLQWVRNNAAMLGVDPNRIVLGGSSRGTFASWRIGHDPAHASFIKGMFMKQALPGSVNETRCGAAKPNTVSGKAPREWVTTDSPPIQFIHHPANINGGCTQLNDRFHSEYNSRPVMEAYVARGIESRASRIIDAPDVGAMDNYLVDFVVSCLSGSAPPTGINFFDDFNSGFNTANYTKNGAWDVAAGALRQTSSSSYGYCAAGESAWTDYTVTATLASLNSLSATDNVQVSRVVARFIDGNNFYEAFATRNGLLVIQSKKAGVVRTLQSVQAGSVDLANWNTLSLACNGNSLTASLNGVAQATITDVDHASGKAGVRSFACETRVDSLSIVGM